MTERGAFVVRKETSGASRKSKKKKRGGQNCKNCGSQEEGGVCVTLII